MNKTLLFSCFVILFFITSCKNEEPTNVIINVEDDIYVDMVENFSSGNPSFQINLSTIQKLNCENYELETDLDFDEQSNVIYIAINDLVEPSDCEAGESVARASIPFGILSNGDYDFNISLQSAFRNNGTLEVANDYFALSLETDDGVDIRFPKLYKMPESTIWGYISYDNNSYEEEANNFIDSLQSLSTIDLASGQDFNTGYYGYFEVNDTRSISMVEVPETTGHKAFAFRHQSDDLSEVMDLVDEWCAEETELQIFIFDEKGRRITCN